MRAVGRRRRPTSGSQAYLDAALTGEADKVAKTAEGGRNDATLRRPRSSSGPTSPGAGLDETVVIAALEAAAETNGYTAERRA